MSTTSGTEPRGASLLRRLLHACSGVSAVEFAVLAPFLTLGALATADAGMAVYQKMMIGQILRSGAQLAIQGREESTIESALKATAADNFTVADGTPSGDELSLAVDSYCICPGDGLGEVSCATDCTSGGSPTRFYELTATKMFPGVMLPDFAISGEISVIAE